MRYKHPQTYLDRSAAGDVIAESVEIGRDELGFEFMLNALRLNGGFAPGLFAERTGLSIGAIDAALNDAEKRGLLLRDHQNIRPSALGQRFLNDLQQIFLNDN
jgi:coproporphyrinogen III oxidase-like Fe-S oxidoreductase